MAKINWNNFAQQFGESFIRTLERERTLRQQQEEFNRKMQFENRQLTLYTDIAKERSAIEKEQSLGSMYREGFTPDIETPDIKMFGQGLDYPKMLPKPITQAETYYENGNLLERKYQGEGEDKVVTDINLLKGFTQPKVRKTRTDKTEKPTKIDLSNEIDELEYWYRTAKETGNKSDYDNVKAKSEALISKADLQTERDAIWSEIKSGETFESAIANINEFRTSQGKEPLTDEQFDALRRYFTTRTSTGYKK